MNRRGRVDDIFNIDLADQNQHAEENGTRPFHRQTSQPNFAPRPGENLGNTVRRRYYTQKILSGKATSRVKAINFMPSRLQRTISVDGHILTSNGSEPEIDEWTQQIIQQDHLMEDSTFAEQLRLETLRTIPQSLTVKRQIKARLESRVTTNSKSKSIGRWKRIKYGLGSWANHAKGSFRNLLSKFEIWYENFKIIEGHFGSSVAAYFKLLRWLFVMNIILLVLTLGFVIIPQILYDSFEVAGPITTEELPAANEKTINLSSTEFQVLDIFTAEGSFTNTILFYGSYSNMTFSLTPPHNYSLPFAYFMTMICLYVATFIYVAVRMARSYRKSYIESYGGVNNYCTHKVFCAWDFGISIEKAAHLKHASLFNELKEILADLKRPKLKESRMKRFWDVSSQITAHLLVFAMLAGLAAGMWMLLKEFGETAELTPWTSLYLSLSVNVTMLVLHFIFNWISLMEEYKSPRTALHINLFRNFLLEIVIIGVLLVFWLTKSYTECWETSIGQEIYRLVLIDFLLTSIGATVLQGIRVLLSKKWENIGRPEFNISRGTLGLIFNQTLLWVGLLFSPVLAVMVVVKMFITFYIKKFTLMHFCKTPTQVWRAAQTQTLYLVLIFLSLLGVVIVHGYIITQVEVSKECGPFRGRGYMFEIFVNGILELKEGNLFWRIVTALIRPAVVGGILIAMGVLTYYLRARAKARIAMVKLLEDMLHYEGQDKEFLLTEISKVTQGKEWLFDQELAESSTVPNGRRSRDQIISDVSSTWGYVPDRRNSNHPSTSGLNPRASQSENGLNRY